MGFILTVVVHSAGIQDRVGARAVLIRLFSQIPGIQKIFAGGLLLDRRRVTNEKEYGLVKALAIWPA